MRKRRTHIVAAGLTGVVVLAGVAWLVGRGIRSPAEVAAGVASPQPSLITVPVVRRTLSSEVIVRGTARYGSPQAVILPTSSLKAGSELVSQPPIANARLHEGSVAFSVSGRPVFVLRGALPANRDLAPSTEGRDVLQLEQALARMGFDPGSIDGRYDGATASAVAAWYRKAGWTPFTPTAAQHDQLRAAQAAAAGARDIALQTELALHAASRGATPAEINQARQDANTARDGVSSAVLAIGASRAQVEAALEGARRARITEKAARAAGLHDRAVAEAELASKRAAAEADVISKRAALNAAIAGRTEARARLEQLLPQPPDETPQARKQALRIALRRATEAVDVARIAVVSASTSARVDLASKQAALSAAIDAQIDAQRRFDEPLADTLTVEREARAASLRQAIDGVNVARSSVDAARSALAATNVAAAAAVGPEATAQAQADVAAAESNLVARQASLAAAIDAQTEAQRRADQPLLDTVAAAREALRVTLRQTTESVTTARDAVDSVSAASEADRVSKQATLSAAIDAQTEAQRRLDQPLIDTLPAKRNALMIASRQASDAVLVARSAVTAAQAALEAVTLTRAPNPSLLLQAQTDARVARRDVGLALAQAARARQSLATARRQALLARKRVSILNGMTDTSIQQQILGAAKAESRRAEAEVARVAAQTGVQIPAGELVFFPTLPLRIDAVNARRGEPVSGAVMTVSNSSIAIDSSLSINDARLVRVGLPVVIEEQDLRIKVMGRVALIANKPGTVSTDPQRVYFEVTPTRAPPTLVGASVRLAIAVSSTHGAVLAVPISALSVVADGTSRVQVDRGGGKTSFVTVVPGLAAQGLVEVRPISGMLLVGDRVVVGLGTGALATSATSGAGIAPAPTPSTDLTPVTTTPAPVQPTAPGPAPAPKTTPPAASAGNVP